MDIVDRLQKVLTSLSYDGPLFNDATQIDQGLRQAKLRGEELAASLDKRAATRAKPKGKRTK